MPIKKSAKKDLRQTIKKATRNLKIKKNIEYLTKKIKKAVEGKNTTEAEKIFKSLQKAIDKAAKTNILKKNTASRKKSRLMKKINSLKKK